MADENLFTIELVTPERILITGSATEVILRTGEGDASFLAGHTPLVGTLEPGVVRVLRADGTEERVAAHGGFVQVEKGVQPDADGTEASAGGTRVTMLVGVAELAGEIDTDRARAALETAEARVAELAGAGGRSAGAGSGSGSGSASGEAAEPDHELAEAEAAVLRAKVRIEATEASTGVVATPA